MLKNRWKFIFATALGVLFVFFAGSSYVIGNQVRDLVVSAQATKSGDPVSALMSVVGSQESTLSEKNSAIWALGQLGNPRALSMLEALETNEECDHTNSICQREVEKAIQLCRGGLNPGAFIWRHGDLASSS